MYITKDDIIKFIGSKRSRTTMKELYDLGLFQFSTPLEVTRELLDELIHIDKLVSGSIEPYGTFVLTPKGMIYLDNLMQSELKNVTELSEHPNDIPDGIQEQPDAKNNLADKKWYQVAMLITAVVGTIATVAALVVSFMK